MFSQISLSIFLSWCSEVLLCCVWDGFLSFYPLWAMLCSLEMCSHNFYYFWKICNYYLLYTSFPPFSLVYYFKLLLSMCKNFYFHLLPSSILLIYFISPKGLWSIVKMMIMKFRIVIICNVHRSYKREHPSERKLIPTSSRFALPGFTIHLIIYYKSTYMLATIGTWWDEPNSDWSNSQKIKMKSKVQNLLYFACFVKSSFICCQFS